MLCHEIWKDIELCDTTEVDVDGIHLTVMPCFVKERFTNSDIVKLELMVAALRGINLDRFKGDHDHILVEAGINLIHVTFNHEYHMFLYNDHVIIDDYKYLKGDNSCSINRVSIQYDNPNFVKDAHDQITKLELFMTSVRNNESFRATFLHDLSK